jgi:subtilisin family serine protease
VAPGDPIAVPIAVDMSAAGGLDIASLQFVFTWDPTQLGFVSNTPGSPPPGDWTVIANETQTGSGALGIAMFSINGTTSSFAATTATLQAGAGVPNGTWATLTLAVEAAGDALGDDVLSAVGPNPHYVLLCIGISGILGDVTDNGSVDIIDAQQVARHSVGLDTPNAPKMQDVGDVTEDGNINIIDAQQIARHAVGLDTPAAPSIGALVPGCEEPPPAEAVISGTITLSDAFVASPRYKVATARPASGRELGRGGKSVAEPVEVPARRLPAPPARLTAAIPTDLLVVSFEPGPLAAPAIGSAEMATMSAAQNVVEAMRDRLEASTPVMEGSVEVTGISPAILAARVRVRDTGRIDEVSAALRRDPAVRRVRRHALLYWRDLGAVSAVASPAEPNDGLYELQAWHYDMIDLPEAWEITTGSAAVLVAVVDDGIRFDHPDLSANLTNDGYDFVPSAKYDLCSGGTVDNAGDGDGYDPDPTAPAAYDWDADQQCATPEDFGSHGTHVAGTIGAVGNEGVGVTGINWTVRIRPVRVVGVAGLADWYDIAQGILYAAGLPADDGSGGVIQAASAAQIINLSLGTSAPDSDLENAIVSAANAGVLIIASAGNEGSAGAHYPSDYPQVVSVSAVGPDTLLASYSNFGPNIDIAAPGGDLDDGFSLFGSGLEGASFGVLSTMWNFSASAPTFVFADGTSMAAPHVSGVAALLLAQDPSLTADQLRARLLDYAVDMGTPGWDQELGAGVLNARNSLTQSQAPPRDMYARLYSASSGAIEATVAVGYDGTYAFAGLADGDYYVFAGQDANDDQDIGRPGRRWGAYGGAGTPSAITVAGAGNYPASFAVGFPFEGEPNDLHEEADPMPVGGYLNGVMFEAVDIMRVVVPLSGLYTFETSAGNGYCGFALNEDTYIELHDASQSLIASNDNIDSSGYNLCSRIAVTLQPGTYFLSVRGWYGIGLPYRVAVRSGG